MKSRLIEEAAELLKGLDASWMFCGGYAIDMFLGRETRKHGDIDICVFENDRNTIKNYMLDRGWDVYEFRGMGKLRKLDRETESDTNRNLMCLKPGCRLVDFYPCDEPGLLYYLFHHTGMEEFDYIEFLFNNAEDGRFVFNKELGIYRELDKAVLNSVGHSYLAPEIALLYKASNADDENNRHDYEAAIPELDDEQRKWLREGLELRYPDDHSWKQNL